MKDNQKEDGNSAGKGRGASYPGVSLETAVGMAGQLYEKLGSGPYSREDVAIALGYSGLTGTSVRVVAALGHYGLLDRTSTSTYSISELAIEIIHTTDETGKGRDHAIVTAALTPRLFEKLVKQFQNQALPTLLENILLREGINRKSSKEVAGILRETLQFAGLLKNGVVVIPGSSESEPSVLVQSNKESQVLPTNATEISSRTEVQEYGYSEAGEGWNLILKSKKPLNSAIRRILIDLIDSLDTNERN